jgi:hypothetical protein
MSSNGTPIPEAEVVELEPARLAPRFSWLDLVAFSVGAAFMAFPLALCWRIAYELARAGWELWPG